MKIYVACALTHVPRDAFSRYVDYIHRLATALRDTPRVSSVRYALVDSDPQLESKPVEERANLCYEWDRAMVEEADLMIADVSFPGTGLGIELQLAESAGIPIVMLVGNLQINVVGAAHYQNPDKSEHDLQIGEGIVSIMALGLPGIRRILHYKSFDEAVSAACAAVQLHTPN